MSAKGTNIQQINPDPRLLLLNFRLGTRLLLLIFHLDSWFFTLRSKNKFSTLILNYAINGF